jgi:beta-glucanase (GH16 family)
MEHGLHATNETSSAIHTPSSFGNTVNTARQVVSDVANNFHVYSVNWSPNQITFLVDDVPYYTYNPSVKNASTWPFDSDQYLILNVAMGGISGTIDPNFTQSSMIIDYVRVYQSSSLSTENEKLEELRIYPNPADETIYLKSRIRLDSVQVFDVLGNRIFEVVNPNNSIDVQSLTSGLYLLKINSEKKTIIKKLVIK